MPYEFHGLSRNWYGELVSGVNDSATSLVVAMAAGSGAHPSTPFVVDLGTERVEVTGVSTDTPSAGQDTLTVVRGADGTTAAAHDAGARIEQRVDPYEVAELQDYAALLTSFLAASIGSTGIQRGGGYGDFAVFPFSPAGLAVTIQGGQAMVDGTPVVRTAVASKPIPGGAPTTNTRIDLVQLDSSGAASVKTGIEGAGAPSPDSGHIALAYVTLGVGDAVVDGADITDLREFL